MLLILPVGVYALCRQLLPSLSFRLSPTLLVLRTSCPLLALVPRLLALELAHQLLALHAFFSRQVGELGLALALAVRVLGAARRRRHLASHAVFAPLLALALAPLLAWPPLLVLLTST